MATATAVTARGGRAFVGPLATMFPPQLPADLIHRLARAVGNTGTSSSSNGNGESKEDEQQQQRQLARSPPVHRRLQHMHPSRQGHHEKKQSRWHTEGRPQWPRHRLFSPLTCAQLFDPPLRLKARFLEPRRVYSGVEFHCHLCGEPAGQAAYHCSGWDHLTRYVGVRLAANYLAHEGRTGRAGGGGKGQEGGNAVGPSAVVGATLSPPPPTAAAEERSASPAEDRHGEEEEGEEGTSAEQRRAPHAAAPKPRLWTSGRLTSVRTATGVASPHLPWQPSLSSRPDLSTATTTTAAVVVRWSAEAVVADAARCMPAGLLSAAHPHPTLYLPLETKAAVVAGEPGPGTAITNSSNATAPPPPPPPLPLLCCVYEREDAVRRAKLAALLVTLARTPRGDDKDNRKKGDSNAGGPAAPTVSRAAAATAAKPILYDGLVMSRAAYPMSNVGERTFRALVSRRVTQLLPPMGAEATTRVQQRCWGRGNLEALFDLLAIGRLQEDLTTSTASTGVVLTTAAATGGVGRVARSKNDKGAVVRQVVQELSMVQARLQLQEEMEAEEWEWRAGATNKGMKDKDPTMSSTSAKTRRHRNRNLKLILIEETLQRLAFELVYRQTAEIMRLAWPVYELLGFPSEAELEESGYY